MQRVLITVVGCITFAAWVWAGLDGSYLLPLEHPAIQYATRPVSDPVSLLQKRLDAGQAKLTWDSQWGYLPSVLKELQVARESQVLVFSKTSFQSPRISPRTPRALYFNSDVSVGFVRSGDVVELAAVDPQQGVVFYTLEQEERAKPKMSREDHCLQCHAVGGTLGVPGFVIRSVFPDRTGQPLFQAGTFLTDDRSPMSERWGGWYVTGTHGVQRHMGNLVFENREDPRSEDFGKGANVSDLSGRFDTGAYLTPYSDIVALLVLEHQVRMTNILTRVNFETRMAISDQQAMNEAMHEPKEQRSDSHVRRIGRLADEVISYMLFTEEAPLTDPVRGPSGFAEAYQSAGVRDKQGRSLRDLDLRQRLLRYRCSPLIYTAQFDALPGELREQVYRKLWAALQPGSSIHWPAAEKQAIREILTETKKGLPSWWSSGAGPA